MLPLAASLLLLAPPSPDCDQVPHSGMFLIAHPNVIRDSWKQSEEFHRSICEQQALYEMMGKTREWNKLKAHAEWCRKVWYHMDDVSYYTLTATSEWSVRERRINDAMKMLRHLLGEEDYQAARVPPPWPVWLFRDIDD